MHPKSYIFFIDKVSKILYFFLEFCTFELAELQYSDLEPNLLV